jgi:hypothetical protein
MHAGHWLAGAMNVDPTPSTHVKRAVMGLSALASERAADELAGTKVGARARSRQDIRNTLLRLHSLHRHTPVPVLRQSPSRLETAEHAPFLHTDRAQAQRPPLASRRAAALRLG